MGGIVPARDKKRTTLESYWRAAYEDLSNLQVWEKLHAKYLHKL